jgi:peptide/nickel transport system permease protein
LTLELATLSLLVSVLIGIPTGVIAAARRGKPGEYVATGVAFIGLCVPSFWLGLLLILWFAVDLHWFPASGYTTMHHPVANLRHMVLPCIVLGAGFAGLLMRHTRSSMLTSLSEDYVRTARAKGVSEWRVVWKHAFRASLITLTTIIGLEFGLLFSAAVVTEQVFHIPGFGQLGLNSINSRDYPVLQGVALLTAAAYVIINLVVDFVYPLLDPRIGSTEGRA